tara:strand:- start:10443 stop:11537 length:1095 start_codon:yes stop_codon:yes gene_type:complete
LKNQKEIKHCQFAYNSFFYNKGNVSNCCLQEPLMFKDDWSDVTQLDNFYYTKEFDDIRFDIENGGQPSQCDTCWRSENNGNRSMRIDNMYYTDKPSSEVPIIRHVDLRLSNKCNLQCKMCNSNDSDQIAKIEGKVIAPTDTAGLLNLIYKLDTVESIRFAGGEPFIMPEVAEFLQRLVDDKKTYIKIEIITNCTSVNTSMVTLLEKFDNVDIMASIDSVGKWFEFQRYPARWNQIDRNFRKLYNSKFSIRIVPCIGNINLLGVDEFFSWANQFPNALVTFNEIFEPSYLNFRYVPLNLREDMWGNLGAMKLVNTVQDWKNFKRRTMYDYIEPDSSVAQLIKDRNQLVWGATESQMKEFFPWIYI